MRQLIAAIASAIRACLRAPVDFLEALYEALRRKPSTAAADQALDQIEAAVAEAEAARTVPEPTSPLVVELEAEVRSALACTIVNEKRAASDLPPIAVPTISDRRIAEWSARLDATQAQRVLNAMKARPGHALMAHAGRQARIVGVPVVLDLEDYEAMAAAELAAVAKVPQPDRRRRSGQA